MIFDVIKRHLRVDATHDWRRLIAGLCLFVLAVGTTACGSSSRSTPKQPTAVIEVENWLVDVGDTYILSAGNSEDFNGETDNLDYFWTAVNEFEIVSWDDHCEDFPDEICDENFDDVCEELQKTDCTVNADCEVGVCKIGKQVCDEKQVTSCNDDDDCKDGDCRTNSGGDSPDCTSGSCNIGGGQTGIIGNFEATVPGPYFVRLLVTGKQANNIAVQLLDTYPSLYLLGGPMFAFGGTEGGLVGRSEDADIFAPGAVRGVSNPDSGNLLLAVPSLASVREFDYTTGEIVGTFGETNKTTDPIALAFDNGGRRLYVANEDGLVQVFDGVTGLAGADFGDVTIGSQRVLSLLFEPNGNLLVIDGRLGQGIREYDAGTGMFLGIFGDTGTAVTQATDAIFFGEAPVQMLISDGAGDVIACNQNGRNCGSWGSAGAMLVAGGPTSITANPSGDVNVSAQVLIGDRFNEYVLGCDDTGNGCGPFGDTTGHDSEYFDVFFAPTQLATTTTTTLPITSTVPPASTSSTTSSTLPVATTSTSTTSSTIISSTTTIPASPTSSR